jgi:hypothetical protein
MKFGVREICDVVLKAKAATKIGNKVFYKNEPVIYFDTLKTSSMEGAATTVYAQGGRGNARLVAWEGERTVTFTMEDALISAEGFMILSGAGLIEATAGKTIKQHITETIDKGDVDVEGTADAAADAVYKIKLSNKPYLPADAGEDFAYVMFCKDGEIISEPFIPVHEEISATDGAYIITVKMHDNYNTPEDETDNYNLATFFSKNNFDSVIVDYYTERKSNAQQIEITADKFGGNYYLEASTLFRDQNGVDMPAEFIIPNCKIQSNFTFTMASSGDPSTFTFTMDAFPDYTRFDHSKKVLAAIQIIEEAGSQDLFRTQTVHNASDDALFG